MFSFRPKLPISDPEREWIDASFDQLIGLFGRERIIESPVVMPTSDYFARGWDPTEKGIAATFDRVCELMKVSRARIQLHFMYVDRVGDELRKSLPHWEELSGEAAGLYREAQDAETDEAGPTRAHIVIKLSERNEPTSIIATMAHEIAHVLLLADRKIEHDSEHMEPLTDLMTVFCGFGIFTANSAVNFRQWSDDQKFGWSVQRLGYLSEPMYGYALARYAQIRGETRPAWPKHLGLNVRTYMEQSTKVLRREAGR